jgi:hypothetical protein
VLVVAPGAHLAGRTHDRVRGRVRQQPELLVRERGGDLHGGQRLDQRRELAQRHAGDREVLERAQRLHAVQRIGRHLALAEQVVLEALRATGEAHRAAAADERRVGVAQALRDGPRGAGDQRRVDGRVLLHQLLEQRARHHRGLDRRQGAARGPVLSGVAQQQPLADSLPRPERAEPHRGAFRRALDAHRPFEQDREEAPVLPLAEDHVAGGVALDRHGARQAPEVAVGQPVQERRAAQAVGEGGGREGHIVRMVN